MDSNKTAGIKVEETCHTQPALRVSQLDAAELDHEVFVLLRGQIQNVFKYFQPQFLVTFGPEVNAALRWVLCHFAIRIQDATIGQKLLDLQYVKDQSTSGMHTSLCMSRRQKIMFTILTVGAPWLEERMDDFAARSQNMRYSNKLWNWMKALIKVWKMAALLNFLVFLMRGRHQFILERLLHIHTVFPHPQSVRQIGFEMMDRELLWHGFAEFLFFVLPLINFQRIKNFVVRRLVPNSSSAGSKAERTAEDLRQCAVCEDWPFNPQEIGCRHVFCYYCIQSNLLADQSYACPLCGHKFDSSSCPVFRPVHIQQAVTT